MVATYMQWFDASSNVTFTIDFDAVESEAPTYAVSITEYPIELGAPLVDFVRPEAVKLKLATYISNAPARTGLSQMDGLAQNNQLAIAVKQPPILPNVPASSAVRRESFAGLDLTRTATQYAVVRTWSPIEQKVQRVEKVYKELQKAMFEAREFTVFSELLGDFDHMLLRSLSTDRTAKSGNAIRLDMELQQVSYAELQMRDVSNLLPKKPKKPKSKPPTDAGKVTTAPVDQKTRTGLKHLLDRKDDNTYVEKR